MQIVLGNRDHPEYGVATIPFPIPREEYDHCIKLLAALEIGDAVQRDCQVLEVSGPWPALKRLEDSEVNLDELDYLAKRLDSFDTMEIAQYQAMTEKLNLRGMTDLINLTFCCQRATVITGFSDLEAVGREHCMNLKNLCASVGELENLDGRYQWPRHKQQVMEMTQEQFEWLMTGQIIMPSIREANPKNMPKSCGTERK